MEDITAAPDTATPSEVTEGDAIAFLQAQITDSGATLADVTERLARVESFLHGQLNEAVILFDARLKAVEQTVGGGTFAEVNAEFEATVKKMYEKMKLLVPMD